MKNASTNHRRNQLLFRTKSCKTFSSDNQTTIAGLTKTEMTVNEKQDRQRVKTAEFYNYRTYQIY